MINIIKILYKIFILFFLSPIFLFTIKGINTSIRGIGILVNNACLVFIAPNAVDHKFEPLHTLDITFKYELIKIRDNRLNSIILSLFLFLILIYTKTPAIIIKIIQYTIFKLRIF